MNGHRAKPGIGKIPDYSKIKLESNPVAELRKALGEAAENLIKEWKSVSENGSPTEKAQVAESMAHVYAALTHRSL